MSNACLDEQYDVRVNSTIFDAVNALIENLRRKDPYTAGHSQRVSIYSAQIGRCLGLPDGEREILGRAALLHDIGKIWIRNAVLFNDRPLLTEEKVHMQKHVGYGIEMLREAPALTEMIPGVRSHHESWNGAGYPHRIAGEAIPLAARIIAVADTFDAMTTDRPYSKHMSADAAVSVIGSLSGVRFDPIVAQAFLNGWEEGSIAGNLATMPDLAKVA